MTPAAGLSSGPGPATPSVSSTTVIGLSSSGPIALASTQASGLGETVKVAPPCSGLPATEPSRFSQAREPLRLQKSCSLAVALAQSSVPWVPTTQLRAAAVTLQVREALSSRAWPAGAPVSGVV